MATTYSIPTAQANIDKLGCLPREAGTAIAIALTATETFCIPFKLPPPEGAAAQAAERMLKWAEDYAPKIFDAVKALEATTGAQYGAFPGEANPRVE